MVSTFVQELLVVGFGKRVLRFDTTKVGKGEVFSAEEPLKCHVEKLIDGVQFVGKHEGEITDLSMCQWMATRLVSASMDGTVCVSFSWCFVFSSFLCLYNIFSFNSYFEPSFMSLVDSND